MEKLTKKLTSRKMIIWTVISAVIFWALPCLDGISDIKLIKKEQFLVLWALGDTAAFIVIGLVAGIWIKDMFPLPIISYIMYVAGIGVYWAVFNPIAQMLLLTLFAFLWHFGVLCVSLLAGVGIGCLAGRI